MTVLPIILAPDPLLKKKSEPVTEITPDILKLCDDLLETMYAANGVGLSAVQVGVLKRVIVIDTEWDSPRYRDEHGMEERVGPPVPGNPVRLINPKIVESSPDLSVYNEGCLSFPGQYSEVERPAKIRVAYTDEHGKKQELTATGLLSTCLQHEIDHMNGIVFVDHISMVKRDIILRKMKKSKKLAEQDD